MPTSLWCILFSIFHTFNTANHIFSLCWLHWKAWKVSCQRRLCPSPTCLTLLFIGFKVALLLAGCKRDHFCFFWLTINNIFIYLNFFISDISVQNPDLKSKLFWQNYCAGPNTPPRWFHLVGGTNKSKLSSAHTTQAGFPSRMCCLLGCLRLLVCTNAIFLSSSSAAVMNSPLENCDTELVIIKVTFCTKIMIYNGVIQSIMIMTSKTHHYESSCRTISTSVD